MKLCAYLALLCSLVVPAPARAGTMIETYGRYQPNDAPWLVKVSDTKLTLGHGTLSSTTSSGITTTVSPKWEAHSGWFVFVQNSLKTWAYDGADSLLFDEVTPKRGITSELKNSFDTITEMPPKEVYDRLPSKMRQMLDAKFSSKH
jgi:hypothetical protein